MSVHISKSIKEPAPQIPVRQHTRQFFPKPHLNQTAFTALTISTILLFGIALSIQYNNLFLEELMVSGVILGMVLFLKSAQHPFQKPQKNAL